MAVPATPVIQGAKDCYRPSEQVALTWTSDTDVTASQVQVYVDGELSSTQAATGTSGFIGKTWTWSATASTLASVGSTVTVLVTATNQDGTSAPANATFTVYDYPTVALSITGGTTVTGLPIEIRWSVSDPTGVSSQGMSIVSSGGTTIYDTHDVWGRGVLAPTARSVTLHASDVPLISDGQTYTIKLDVTNGKSLTTTAQETFTTSWAAVTRPEIISVEYDSDSMTATVAVHTSPQTTATVWRVIDGERTVIGSGSDTFTVVDPFPPLGCDYEYESSAVNDETGAVSPTSTYQANFSTKAYAINFGANAEECIVMHYNPDEDRRIEHGGELYHFADGGTGGGLPVYYSTTDREESGTFSWDTCELAVVDRLNTLSLQYPVGWIRDPFGHRWRAHIVPKVSHDRANVWRISLDWDAVRWEEP